MSAGDLPLQLPAEIKRGLELFNGGEYFESHEVMEDAWRDEPGEIRVLYQGLIQAAVACHHVRTGNRAGAIKMLTAAVPKLELHREGWRGVDVETLLADLAGVEQQIEAGGGLSDISLPSVRFN